MHTHTTYSTVVELSVGDEDCERITVQGIVELDSLPSPTHITCVSVKIHIYVSQHTVPYTLWLQKHTSIYVVYSNT